MFRYIPPLSCGSPSLPETREAITEELRKQESLLGQLHSEMLAGICTKNREEQLWEVQRIITQLKVMGCAAEFIGERDLPIINTPQWLYLTAVLGSVNLAPM